MIEIKNQKEIAIYSILFCFTLFLAITISPPGFHYNDEWITANQLHQLGAGKQLITNEGKYGTFIGNQATEYFTSRANVLGYSLFLPIVAFPVHILFLFTDHSFRFAVLLLWASLPVLVAVLTLNYFPSYSKVFKIPWPWILIGCALFGLIWNLALFYPFSASGPFDPIEAASLIFTSHILFAFLSMVLFYICRSLFENSCYALFGTLSIICSSSYLYWASSAKDHILVALVFAGIIAALLIYVQRNDVKYAIFSFIGCGLLAWARPELAFVMFLANIGIYYGAFYFSKKTDKTFKGSTKPKEKKITSINYKKTVILLLIPLFVLAGSIPFFVNNLFITGNPLTPSYLFITEDFTLEPKLIDESHEVKIDPVISSQAQSSSLILFVIKYFEPRWNSLLSDLLYILFAPLSGMISIFAICPLLLIGIGIYILNKIFPIITLQKDYSKELIVCTIAILAVFIAYISDFHGLIISQGIGPDLRYLSPLYIPGSLIGLIALRGIFSNTATDCALIKRLFFSTAIISPVLFCYIIFSAPFGGGFNGYTQFISISVYVLVSILLISLLIRSRIQYPDWINQFILGLILALPLTWNFLLVIMFSVTRGNGYPFWLPVLERLYYLFVIPIA